MVASPKRTIINDRVCRVATYVEPDVYDIIEDQAKQQGETISAWLRSVVLSSLIDKSLVSTELLHRLAIR